jgi:SAM-dependent methyltransferase
MTYPNKPKSSHYDAKYFQWQSSIGEFGGWANRTKFIEFITPTTDALDFGCGGGYLLDALPCRKKVGVEVNPAAAETARQKGIEVFQTVHEVPDDYVDVILSNNALEHALHPLDEIKALYTKLRNNGKIVFVVPCESIRYAYKPNDINRHLYSWSPMSIANLFTEAGYKPLESKPYIHKWPPYYRLIAKLFGRKGFELASRIYGRIERSWFQIRIVAVKDTLT